MILFVLSLLGTIGSLFEESTTPAPQEVETTETAPAPTTPTSTSRPTTTVTPIEPPLAFTFVEEYAMSRGDYGYKIDVGSGHTKEEVYELADYLQNNYVEYKDGQKQKIRATGTGSILRAVTIIAPYPSDSNATRQTIYVQEESIQGVWFK